MERKKILTSDRNEIIGRQRSRCNRCGEILDPRNTHIDHIIPVEEGTDNIGNLQALCGSCHNKKTHEDRLRQQHLKEKDKNKSGEDSNWGLNIKKEDVWDDRRTKYDFD
jgi:5-methylcytosine-specific restriction endonuclease McrA